MRKRRREIIRERERVGNEGETIKVRESRNIELATSTTILWHNYSVVVTQNLKLQSTCQLRSLVSMEAGLGV